MRLALMCLAALALGCGSSPVYRSPHPETFQLNPVGGLAPKKAEFMGHCRASRRVRVTDAAGLPVENASVIVRQYASDYAGGDRLAGYAYSAEPVRTDAEGRAWVCEPDALVPRSRFEGMGGGFSVRNDGEILASEGGRSTSLRPPFATEPRLVLPP